MAHQTVRAGYEQLVDRLNRFPQGAPPSDVLYAILKMLFSEREAGVALLPVRPFTAKRAARVVEDDAGRRHGDPRGTGGRASSSTYSPTAREPLHCRRRWQDSSSSPSCASCVTTSTRSCSPSSFYQYLNVEEDFMKELFSAGETQLGRVFVQEPMLSSENAVHVLDYERASEVDPPRFTSRRGYLLLPPQEAAHGKRPATRPCRHLHDLQQLRRPSLTRHGHARAVDVAEGLDLLDQAPTRNDLVQFGENVQHGRELHLQLLRLLLRGDDGAEAP